MDNRAELLFGRLFLRIRGGITVVRCFRGKELRRRTVVPLDSDRSFSCIMSCFFCFFFSAIRCRHATTKLLSLIGLRAGNVASLFLCALRARAPHFRPFLRWLDLRASILASILAVILTTYSSTDWSRSSRFMNIAFHLLAGCSETKFTKAFSPFEDFFPSFRFNVMLLCWKLLVRINSGFCQNTPGVVPENLEILFLVYS